MADGVYQIGTRASRRNLLLVGPLVAIVAAYMMVAKLLFVHPVFGMPLRVIGSSLMIGGGYMFACFVFPDYNHTIKDKFAYGTIFLLRIAAHVAWFFYHDKYLWLTVAVATLLYFLMHFTYGPSTGNPPTFAKYIMPPFYFMFWGASMLKPFVPSLGLNGFFASYAYFIPATVVLIAADRPIAKSKRKDNNGEDYEILGDGYYFALYFYMVIASGFALNVVLLLTSKYGTLVQSLSLQLLSVLILSITAKVSLRSSDHKRFEVLMLPIYFQVDTLQAFLFLKESAFSVDFWVMILLQEASSIFKNCGLTEFFGWVLGLKKDFPYTDRQTLRMLKSKGLVDSMSEIIGGVSAFCMFAMENEVRGWAGALTFNVTVVQAGSSTLNITSNTTSFITPACMSNCVGYSVNQGIPPPEVTQTLPSLFLLLFCICLTRVVFLGVEIGTCFCPLGLQPPPIPIFKTILIRTPFLLCSLNRCGVPLGETLYKSRPPYYEYH